MNIETKLPGWIGETKEYVDNFTGVMYNKEALKTLELISYIETLAKENAIKDKLLAFYDETIQLQKKDIDEKELIFSRYIEALETKDAEIKELREFVSNIVNNLDAENTIIQIPYKIVEIGKRLIAKQT